MRKIKYILIHEAPSGQSPRDRFPLFGYHFSVNSEALVVPLLDIHPPVSLAESLICAPDKFNRCSIAIRYCESLRPGTWLLESPGTLHPATRTLRQREALIALLVQLRHHFPDAKIFGLSELGPRECNAHNIIVSDTINLLLHGLSDYP